ncbi:hypothetical protein, partial [Escherichia coli]|uniref:hypothetical protein n=1 Tax=Escherichia coli TaxID=562 RepID=UPI001954EA3F
QFKSSIALAMGSGTFINKLGKKLLLGTFSVASGLCVISIYFSQNTATVVTLSSLFLSLFLE